MRSKRTSSLSFSQKADPSSTMYSQVMTDSSDVQPIGKLKKYRKTIWMMNATNIMPSRPATMFSARRLIQSTAVARSKSWRFSGPPLDLWVTDSLDRRRAWRPSRSRRNRGPPQRPAQRSYAFSALILSSIPGGHALASSEARYTFCA